MSDKIPPISNPESLLDSNPALDRKLDDKSPPSITVTLESIDSTIVNHLKDTINPKVTYGERSQNVPVIWANPERWKAIQKDGFLRDPKNDKQQCPLISIRRINISRDELTNPSNKYIYRTFTTQWNRRNAYDRFAVQNRVTPSQQLRRVVIPDYIKIIYEMVIWADFESQMNEVIEQINVENEEWWGPRNDFKFRTRIDEYTSENDLPATSDRVVRSTFNMNVSAYLLPSTMIKKYAKQSTNEDDYTKKKVVIFKEAVNSMEE